MICENCKTEAGIVTPYPSKIKKGQTRKILCQSCYKGAKEKWKDVNY